MSHLETQRTVEWGDCDEAGVVFYPNYFRWMDGAFNEICSRYGYDQRGLRSQFGVFATPLLNAQMRFALPSTYGDQLRIQARFGDWGSSSFTVRYRFFKADQLVVEGEEKRVFVNKTDDGQFRSTAIPEAFRERLSHD